MEILRYKVDGGGRGGRRVQRGITDHLRLPFLSHLDFLKRKRDSLFFPFSFLPFFRVAVQKNMKETSRKCWASEL